VKPERKFGFPSKGFFITVWGYNGKTLNCLVPVNLKAREVLYKLKVARFAFFSQIRFFKRAMGERGRTYKSKVAIYNMNNKDIKYTTTSASSTPIVVTSNAGKCWGGHTWTFSGGINYVLEGTYCDCGITKYKTQKKCETCERAF